MDLVTLYDAVKNGMDFHEFRSVVEDMLSEAEDRGRDFEAINRSYFDAISELYDDG